jgi:general stress protein YciG
MPVSGGSNRGLGSTNEERQRDVSRDTSEATSQGAGGRGVAASDRRDEERAIRPTRESGGARTTTGAQGAQGARRTGKSLRGFASMDPERQREIASKGGRAAHAKGTAHEWSSDEARVAGRKGGEAVSRDRAHMAQIGREGGEARGKAARAQSGSRTSSNGAGGSDSRSEGNRP